MAPDIFSLGNVITMISCIVAITVFIIRQEGKIKNLEEKRQSDKQQLEERIKAEAEINKLKFENKSEKVDALFKFKDEISQNMIKEFADLKDQLSEVNETLQAITTTLSLCDVTPKRRDTDK